MSSARSRFEVVTTRPAGRGLSVWPMDLALLVISCLIMVLVLKYLRFDDSRLIYNAWTYLVGVPSVMIALSMLLHLTTGKFIERTLQLSFLASVAVHLLLLVGTLNVMIFAKYWPDVYDAIVAETTPQKSIQAEFHRPVLAASKVRPDFLRPVPTESESEERPTPRARRENLANLQPMEMPTDTKPTETPEPFLIPNPQPSPSQPLPSSSAADLQRQRLQADMPRPSRQIDLPDLDPNVTTPAEPTARDGSIRRSQPTQSSSIAKSMMTPLKEDSISLSASAIKIEPRARAELNPEVTSREASLPKVANANRPMSERPREAQIPLPEAMISEASGVEIANAEARAETITKKNDPIHRSSLRSLDETLKPSEQADPSNAMATQVVRSERGRRPIESLPGDIKESPKRNTSGGVTSELSASSQTLAGPKSFESQSTVENRPAPGDVAASLQANQLRRRSDATQSSSLSSMARDTLVSPNLNSVAQGGSNVPEGMSAAKGGSEGPAIANDNAGMMGSEGPIARSRLGDAGGSNVPTLNSKVAIAESAGATTDSSGSAGSMDARSFDTVRKGDKSGSRTGRDDTLMMPGMQNDPSSTVGSSLAGNGIGIQARRGNDDWQKELAASSERQASGPKQKGRRDGISNEGLENGSLNGPLAQKEVPVPIEAGAAGGKGDLESLFGAEPSSLVESGGGRMKADGGPSLDSSLAAGPAMSDASPSLAIEKGLGGLERRPREVELPEVRITDLQTQRFRRNDLGGLTLGGEGVPIPVPAFQRRLDRNRDPSDSENSGALGPEVEQTIERGLAFLAANQRADGSWHLEDFDTQVDIRSDTAATALSLLAFQGAGYTHQQDKYANNVARGLQFLMRSQRNDGDLYVRMDKASDMNAWLYSHSIASLALCESYGMTQDPQLQKPAQRAVDFMVASQDKSNGGWRYTPGVGSDVSVTGWFMMALKSAQLSGLEVDPEVFQNIRRWLDNSQASPREKHLYRYNWKAPDTVTQRHGREVTPIMTSIGLLMRLYLGWKRDDLPMQEGAKYLLNFPPAEGTKDAPLRDTYYWYYATQLMFHMGGDTWKEWNSRLRPILVESQVDSGKYAGSWEPKGEIPDAWGGFGGRLYVTTLNLLSLEVYYRHLPLYEATAK